MTDNAWSDDSGIGVTIKTGKGFEDTWFTFRGNNAKVREDIAAFFGMESASVSELTTYDIAVNATRIAQGVGAVSAKLGATVVSSKPASEPAPAPAPAKQEEKSENPILVLIEQATTVDDLRRIWAGNQEAFKDADLMAKWKAKGSSLKKAAA